MWLRFAASRITQPTYKIEPICSPRPLVTGDSALPTQHVELPLPNGFTLPVGIVRERTPQVRIRITKDAAFAVLELEGRLAAGHGAGCLSDTVDILLTQGLQHIFLDMHLVDLLDCAGIGQLVRCYCRARGRDASLT